MMIILNDYYSENSGDQDANIQITMMLFNGNNDNDDDNQCLGSRSGTTDSAIF